MPSIRRTSARPQRAGLHSLWGEEPSKSCVPRGIRPSPSPSVIISSRDRRCGWVWTVSSARPARARRAPATNAAGSATCSITSIEVTRSKLARPALDPHRAIVDRQPLPRSAWPRAAAIFSGAASIAVTVGAQPRQRLGQQSRAAADVERALARQRPPAVLVLPMRVDPLAQIAEPHRVQLVEHRRGALRVPPFGRQSAEMRGFGADRSSSGEPSHVLASSHAAAP